MKYPLTVAFMLYHEGDPRLDDVIARVVDWINANSQFDIIPIVKRSTWDGVVDKKYGRYHLDPRDIDWTEVPPANFVVMLWSCLKFVIPNEAAVCPFQGGLVYGPRDYAQTGRISAVISVPYYTNTDPMLPEGTDTTAPDRELAKAQARLMSGWYAGIDSTIIHEFQNMLVAYLRDKHNIWMKSTYRPQPGDPLQDWFDDQDPLFKYEPDLYKSVFAAMTPEMYEKLADFVPQPPVVPAPTPVEGSPVEPPVPTLPPGLRDKLMWVQEKLQGMRYELEELEEGLVEIIASLEKE